MNQIEQNAEKVDLEALGLDNSPLLAPFKNVIKTVLEIPNEVIATQEARDYIINVVNENLSGQARQNIINDILQNFSGKRITKQQVKDTLYKTKISLSDMIDNIENLTDEKRNLLIAVLDIVNDIFQNAYDQYNQFDLIIQVKSENQNYKEDIKNILMLYAAQDITLPPNSFGNLVPIDCKYKIPDGWYQTLYSPYENQGLYLMSNNQEEIIYNNLTNQEYKFWKGELIAFARFMPIYPIKVMPNAN